MLIIITTTIFLITTFTPITMPGTLFIMSVSCYKEKVRTCALHHYKMKSMDIYIRFENIAQIARVIRLATAVQQAKLHNRTLINVKLHNRTEINVKLHR